MGPKRALVILAMARQGGSVSSEEITEAQDACGISLRQLSPKHTACRIGTETSDDEDVSDVYGINNISA